IESATRTVAMVLAHTMVLAPNHGASSRAAAISAPRLAMPTQKTTISSSGARLVVTRETYRSGGRSGVVPGHCCVAPLLSGYPRGHERKGGRDGCDDVSGLPGRRP